MMSKYFGESTKIVSELYGTARDMSPAVVFLDEFASLCGSRNEGDTGTERRILSTILSELDGLSEKGRELWRSLDEAFERHAGEVSDGVIEVEALDAANAALDKLGRYWGRTVSLINRAA